MIDDVTFRRLVRSRDFLAGHFAEPVNLEKAAAEAYLSPFHYHRLFVRAFGQTPHEFVTQRRLEQAKLILSAEDLPVLAVCMSVGFESLGSFSSLFRERVGLPPAAYRRSLRRIYNIPWAPPHRLVPCCFLSFFGAQPV